MTTMMQEAGHRLSRHWDDEVRMPEGFGYSASLIFRNKVTLSYNLLSAIMRYISIIIETSLQHLGCRSFVYPGYRIHPKSIHP